MDEDQEFELRLSECRKKWGNADSFSILGTQLLQSPLPYSWKLLDELIQTASADNTRLMEVRGIIDRSIRSIKSFTMLIYIYSLKQQKKGLYSDLINWRGEYEEVALQIGDITIFSSWISTHFNTRIAQLTLWMVVRMFPLLLRNEALNFGQVQLTSVIQWVAYFYTPDPDTDKYSDICELIKVAKQTRLSSLLSQDKAQYILLRKLIEVVCQAKCPSSNLFLFLYPMPLMDQEITYFCEIYSDFLSDLSEEGLCNLFNGLTRAAACKETFLVIQKISHILANQEQFYKLRQLYQKFILPVLAKRAKACARVQQITFQICSLYVLGFLKHCDVGIEGIQCLVRNVGKVTNHHIRTKWVQLCSTVCAWYPDLKAEATSLIQDQLQATIDLESYQLECQEHEGVWNITLRNGRKHKKYVKVPSQMRGILNRNNECYIISTVHGLQKSVYFQALLDKYRDSIKGNCKLLDELRILFNEVSGNRKADKIMVSYLKKVSPDQFVKSQHQEDAYEYLIKLFDLIEIEMKKIPNMLDEFKSIFEVQENNTLVCRKCKQEKTTNTIHTYVHTIANTLILSELTEEPLADFTCPACQETGSCAIRTRLCLKSKIFIVHINRFSANLDGTIKKELSTQRILRKFLNYELVGLICHKGKKAERGHYVYYHQISPRRWAHFNDNSVEEFELEQPYEQFERQWKSEISPYILFYKMD